MEARKRHEMELDVKFISKLEEENYITYCFAGGKEQLEQLAGDQYPEADMVSIKLKVPIDSMLDDDIIFDYTPVKKMSADEDEDYTDYDLDNPCLSEYGFYKLLYRAMEKADQKKESKPEEVSNVQKEGMVAKRECMITRSSIINRCNSDGQLHLLFTEQERPCEEAYLKKIKGCKGVECSRYFIELEDRIGAVDQLGTQYDVDVLVTENMDFPGIVSLVLYDEEVDQTRY